MAAVSRSALRLVPGDRVRVALGQAFLADGSLLHGRHPRRRVAAHRRIHAGAPRNGATRWSPAARTRAPVTLRVQRRRRHAPRSHRRADARGDEPAAGAGPHGRPAGRAVPVGGARPGRAAAAAWSVIDPSRVVGVAVAVLIVTRPCALALSVPAALVAAAGGLARRGVLCSGSMRWRPWRGWTVCSSTRPAR